MLAVWAGVECRPDEHEMTHAPHVSEPSVHAVDEGAVWVHMGSVYGRQEAQVYPAISSKAFAASTTAVLVFVALRSVK